MSVRWLKPYAMEKRFLALFLASALFTYWLFRSGSPRNGLTRHRWVPKGGILAHRYGAVQPFLEPLNPSGRQWDLQKCHRCSIVGNTGLLLHSYVGNRIDASNCIFRFGFAPTDSAYGRDVGKRTTVRLIDSSSLKNADVTQLQALTDANHVIIFDTHSNRPPMQRTEMQSLFRPSTQVWQLSEYGLMRANTILKQEASRFRFDIKLTKPSAMWLAFLLTYDTQCFTTQVFGVPGPDYCRFRSRGFVPSHYWNLHSEAMCDVPTGNELPFHHEAVILRTLADSYNLTYEEPSWD